MVQTGREEGKQARLDLIAEVASEIVKQRMRLWALIRTAKASGCSLSEIGEAVGVSKQAIHEALRRHS